MSVYQPKKSPYFAYDFELDNRRFFGSTRRKNRTEAKAVEKAERVKARAAIEKERADGAAPLTIDTAIGRYWLEVGQHHAASATTWTNLDRLERYFGAKRLDEIADRDVAELVAWRRGQRVRGRAGEAPFVRAATVNRSTTQMLQKVFNRAIRVWGVKLGAAPKWGQHLLREEQERVREIRGAEEGFLEAIRADYRPLIAFARASGLRLSECLMSKDCVDLAGGYVRMRGKGGRTVARPITTEMRAILMAEMANPTRFVFTYAAARARRGAAAHAKGQRLPITASGLKTLWRRSRHKKKGPALPADLRFHDLRHDFATKLLRETGNLKLVQRALGHAKIETTTRYAHVLDEEVLAGMEAASRRRKSR